MKTLFKYWLHCTIVLLVVLACRKIDDVQPLSDFEKSKDDLPEFIIEMDSNNLVQTLSFNRIAQGGNFQLKFTPLLHGKIAIGGEGRTIEITMFKTNWKKDSSRYTILKNGVSREGDIVIENKSFRENPVDPDTACRSFVRSTYYLPFVSSVEIKNLFTGSRKGIINSFKADFWTVSNIGDSVLRFESNGGVNDQDWAWDTVRYKGTGEDGKCYQSTIAFVIGDTCEAHAKNDVFSVPTGSTIWPEADLTANDKSCTGQLGSYQTRTPYTDIQSWEYGNYKQLATKHGVLTDTLIGTQHYKYVRTNPSATEDGFYYYFKNLSTNRVTKAWVRILFN